MTRSQIVTELKKYFKTQELVGEETYKKLGKDSWQVFDKETLHCLLIMRYSIGKPFTVNTWHNGGIYDERGFRSNIQEIVKDKTEKNTLYLSGHPIGKAFDFTVKDMEAEAVRDWIEAFKNLFPCKIRLEWRKDGVPISWVHFDTKWTEGNPKIYKFDV